MSERLEKGIQALRDQMDARITQTLAQCVESKLRETGVKHG